MPSPELLSSILVFADGACSGNPGPGGWAAIVVTPDGQVTELGGREAPTTNNRMELQGVISALTRLESSAGPVAVHTDSTYVIRGITQWSWGWRKNGWKTADGNEVSNAELWKRLIALVAKRGKENPISWHYVRGHAGVPGNERVDEIAVAYSKGQFIELYRGPLLKYSVAVHDLPESTELPEMRPREAKTVAHSYLSLIGNQVERHATWADCERRVKGRSGAKFKKTTSAQDERSVLKSWGLNPDAVHLKK